MACSLDGFIAGADDDLSWLEVTDDAAPPREAGALTFEDFLPQLGAMVMGRRTHDIVARMGIWPYGDLPVLVATRRDLAPARPTARAIEGSIADILAEAKRVAKDKDVYLDGGDVIRQGLDAGLVDEMTITLVPVLLGKGVPLFDGLARRHDLQFTDHRTYGGGLVQLTVRPRPS